MKKIACWAVKGGTGKSTVVANLAFALRDRGYRVGALDVDISCCSLHKAFSLNEPPRLGLGTNRQKMLPPVVEGVKLFCLSSKFTEDAAIGWSETDREITLSDGSRVVDKGRRGFIREILTSTIDWGELDYLICDLPPASGTEVLSFFDYLQDLYGIILVSQPSSISVVGLRKTIDYLKTNEKPVLGLVENMAKVLCPYCSQEFYPFVSSGVDLKKLAREESIPFLVSIPQVSDMRGLKPYFAELAEKVIKAKTKVLKQSVLSTIAKVERAGIKKGLGL